MPELNKINSIVILEQLIYSFEEVTFVKTEYVTK